MSPYSGAAGSRLRPVIAADGTRPATPPRGRILGAPMTRGLAAHEGGEIRISGQVFVSLEKDFTHLVKKPHAGGIVQVAIESLEEEGRKIHSSNVMANIARHGADEDVHTKVIASLLQPLTWSPDPDPNNFILNAAE
ncbi:unnamed protein product, partial [Polarella glacialis]